MSKLLLIDDDDEVLTINKKYLCREGFQVYTTSNPMQGIQLVKELQPDCILLDIMMPGMDGFELCSSIRRFSSIPIIFLSGKTSENDKITGLLTGADDYIVKPYSLRELKVRIDVLLRRAKPSSPITQTNQISFGDLVIDKLTHKAFFKKEDLQLANREYEVLLYLASHPNQEITFEELGTALFGTYQEIDRRSVMVNVSRLRKKMSIDPLLERFITTVWSKGYKFEAK